MSFDEFQVGQSDRKTVRQRESAADSQTIRQTDRQTGYLGLGFGLALGLDLGLSLGLGLSVSFGFGLGLGPS